MTPHPLHAIFERIFGDGEMPDATARARKAGLSDLDVHSLSTEIEPHPHVAPGYSSTDSDTAIMAAWLDNGLEGPALEDFNARLAHSPELLEDASSAEAFLDAARASPQSSPTALVQAAIETGRPSAKGPAPSHRGWWKWSVIGLAMAAAVAAIVLISPRQAPTDQKSPMTAGQVPRSDVVPIPGIKGRESKSAPSMAGKAGTSEGMAPVSSEETMPIQGTQRGKLAP